MSDKIAGFSDLKKALDILADAAEAVVARGQPAPILSGGAFVALLSSGAIMSGDIDLISSNTTGEMLREELIKRGFEIPSGPGALKKGWGLERVSIILKRFRFSIGEMGRSVNRARSDAGHRARPVCHRTSANRKPEGTGGFARFASRSSSNMLWHVLRPHNSKPNQIRSVGTIQTDRNTL